MTQICESESRPVHDVNVCTNLTGERARVAGRFAATALPGGELTIQAAWIALKAAIRRPKAAHDGKWENVVQCRIKSDRLSRRHSAFCPRVDISDQKISKVVGLGLQLGCRSH